MRLVITLLLPFAVILTAPRVAHAESGRFNLHVDLGVVAPPMGGYAAVAADWRVAGPFALEAAIGAGIRGGDADLFGNSTGPTGFVTLMAGARFRILDDQSGYPSEGGSLHGQLWVAPHFGVGVFPGGASFVFDVGVGYELSVASPLSLGLFVRPTFAMRTDGLDAAVIAGITASFEFLTDRAPVDPDLDHDGVLNGDDQCPGTQIGTEVDARGCVPIVEVLVLEGITFAFDSAVIEAGAGDVLEHARRMLVDNQDVLVEIGGHTDDIGDPAHNDRLSRERAQSVADWLREHGVSGARLRVRGYGSQVPREPNVDEASRSRNRRIEFRVVR